MKFLSSRPYDQIAVLLLLVVSVAGVVVGKTCSRPLEIITTGERRTGAGRTSSLKIEHDAPQPGDSSRSPDAKVQQNSQSSFLGGSGTMQERLKRLAALYVLSTQRRLTPQEEEELNAGAKDVNAVAWSSAENCRGISDMLEIVDVDPSVAQDFAFGVFAWRPPAKPLSDPTLLKELVVRLPWEQKAVVAFGCACILLSYPAEAGALSRSEVSGLIQFAKSHSDSRLGAMLIVFAGKHSSTRSEVVNEIAGLMVDALLPNSMKAAVAQALHYTAFTEPASAQGLEELLLQSDDPQVRLQAAGAMDRLVVNEESSDEEPQADSLLRALEDSIRSEMTHWFAVM